MCDLCEEIFEGQLVGWYTDMSTWPRDRTFDVFCRWCRYQHQIALLPGPLSPQSCSVKVVDQWFIAKISQDRVSFGEPRRDSILQVHRNRSTFKAAETLMRRASAGALQGVHIPTPPSACRHCDGGPPSHS